MKDSSPSGECGKIKKQNGLVPVDRVISLRRNSKRGSFIEVAVGNSSGLWKNRASTLRLLAGIRLKLEEDSFNHPRDLSLSEGGTWGPANFKRWWDFNSYSREYEVLILFQ